MRPKDSELDDLDSLTDILNDLGIDGRTKPAVKITRIKRALKTGGAKAFIEIFTANIALNLMIENELVKELMRKGEFIDEEGNLAPAVSKDLMKLRGDTLSYLKMLQSIQGNNKGDKPDNPLANLLNDN